MVPYRGFQRFSRQKDEAMTRFISEHGLRRPWPPTGPRFWELKARRLPPCLASHLTRYLGTCFIKQVVISCRLVAGGISELLSCAMT